MTSLKEQTYLWLKQEITQLKLKPGTQLIETEISKQLGVSRTPVREAIRQLVDEKLAVVISPRMTVVASINQRDVEEIYEVRQSLEILALEMSFAKIDQSQVDEFITLYQKEEISEEEAYEADRKMHNLWINASGNSRLVNILHELETEVERYRLYSHRVPEREAKSIAEHQQILHAIRELNLPAAKRKLSYHLESTKNNILASIEKTQKLP